MANGSRIILRSANFAPGRLSFVAYHFDFDRIHRIARFRLEAHISDEDLREYYAAATRFASLTNPAAGLLDASGVTSLDVSAETVRELASRPPNIPDQADQRVARVLIAPSPVAFGMMRMFEMLGEQTRPNLHVVHTEREALAILGVVSPRFEPVPEWSEESGSPSPASPKSPGKTPA